MILKNARDIFTGISTGANWVYNSLAGTSRSAGSTDATRTFPRIRAFCGYNSSYHSYNQPNAFVEVGYGDTPVTAEDYNLADSNASNSLLTCVSSGKNTAQTNEIMSIYANFRNNGASNVTVREIGVVLAANYDYNNVDYALMAYRKVLDTPIIIAPGETYNFSYVVRFKS